MSSRVHGVWLSAHESLQPAAEASLLLVAEPAARVRRRQQHVYVVFVLVTAASELVVRPLDGAEHTVSVDVRRLLEQKPSDEARQLRYGVGQVAVFVVRVELGVLVVEQLASFHLKVIVRLLQLAFGALVLHVRYLQVTLHSRQLDLEARHSTRQLSMVDDAALGRGARQLHAAGDVVVDDGIDDVTLEVVLRQLTAVDGQPAAGAGDRRPFARRVQMLL